jgi:hypothetical protein
MRAETRETLLQALARARLWLGQILTGQVDGPDAIARREGCSRRQVNSTISLASLAPDIVEAAVAGRLPHGIALRDLTDPPLLWSEQRRIIGPEQRLNKRGPGTAQSELPRRRSEECTGKAFHPATADVGSK